MLELFREIVKSGWEEVLSDGILLFFKYLLRYSSRFSRNGLLLKTCEHDCKNNTKKITLKNLNGSCHFWKHFQNKFVKIQQKLSLLQTYFEFSSYKDQNVFYFDHFVECTYGIHTYGAQNPNDWCFFIML